jgi:hypothetical protein
MCCLVRSLKNPADTGEWVLAWHSARAVPAMQECTLAIEIKQLVRNDRDLFHALQHRGAQCADGFANRPDESPAPHCDPGAPT